MGRGRGRPKKENVLSPLIRTLELEKGTKSCSTSRSIRSSKHEGQDEGEGEKGDSTIPEFETTGQQGKVNNEEDQPKKL
ncbi:unnamed protein product [Lathyrus sativus]|nr:unnamed protein product [Lathyrus sativus]